MPEISRRTFIKLSASAVLSASALPAHAFGRWVNDTHSGLNSTRVSKIIRPTSQSQLRTFVQKAAKDGQRFSVCGARHSAGGQQFLEDHVLLDCKSLNRVLALDAKNGLLTVEPGASWADLLGWLHGAYTEETISHPGSWMIRQRPTGTDSLTIGGTLSSNAHGQGLNFKPLIDDIESFDFLDASGQKLRVSRNENAELFRLAVGGYGLFGLVTAVTLKLVPIEKYRCQAEEIAVADIAHWHASALREGCKYGSVQINIDDSNPDFLLRGVASKFTAVPIDTKIENRKKLSGHDWSSLVALAHNDKARAWERFSKQQLAASGLVEWGFSWHSSPYVTGYHRQLDNQNRRPAASSEVLTEIYVPMRALATFMTKVKEQTKSNRANIVYSTVRFIDQDTESFLAWAKESYACVIFNLHVEHTAHNIAATAEALRGLIDLAINEGGSYYLTYHRFADKQQLLSCYPQFPKLLSEKLRLDPREIFSSDWYCHYKRMFS